jgi:hypothetical protein
MTVSRLVGDMAVAGQNMGTRVGREDDPALSPFLEEFWIQHGKPILRHHTKSGRASNDGVVHWYRYRLFSTWCDIATPHTVRCVR